MNNKTQKTADILVVDDIPDNLDLLSEILASQGYRVRGATSGRLALQSVAAQVPELVILDINMPEMDGYEVCRRLKADPRTSAVPVIFVTVRDEAEDEEKGLSLGAADYITKPFKPAIVLARVISQIRRRQAEEEKRALEEQLWRARKAESLGRMAGAIAHNFNNQLYVVIANLEMTLDDLPGDAPRRENIAEALQAARCSAETSRLMLTCLGQNMGKGEPIDLSDVCRRNLPSLRGVITDGITLETGLMDAGPVVRASPAQMQQILTHLITNAVEAIGDSGGKIMLATGILPADDISESSLALPGWKPDKNSYACLEVTDSGCGIAKDDLDKIFDPFFTTKFTGRGLGLAMVLGIVRHWNGVLGVESGKGKGTTLRVFFPLTDDAVPSVPQKDTAVKQIPAVRSVLLVDDKDTVRKMAGLMLKRLGHPVIAASGGTEAIGLFNRHRDEIGCVITDLTMPGMDGWETIAALRRIDPDIPIILVSGYDEADVLGREQSERPQAFLHKPYTKIDLKAALAVVGKEAGN